MAQYQTQIAKDTLEGRTTPKLRSLVKTIEDPTKVELITSVYRDGKKEHCRPRIVFKVVIFRNGKSQNCHLHVEPVISDTGDITDEGCTLRLV